ncbi:MAG: ATP-binding protein [Candidatus Woesearchaeota archaeon]
MILGKITGRVTTSEFNFLVEENPQKFDYVQVYHREYGYVLCQIVEIERKEGETKAKCTILGYLDQGRVKPIRTPFEPGCEVLPAEDSFIQDVVKLDNESGAYLGFLEGKRIPIHMDLNKLLTKHVAILAKSGAGKSYTVGVLLEEIMEKKVPLLLIDPHGEHSAMKYPNDKDDLESFGIVKKGFLDQIEEYGDTSITPDLRPLKLQEKMSTQELLHLLPAKLSANQQNVLYAALKNVEEPTFVSILQALELEENNAKYSVINIIDYLYNLGIFSQSNTPYEELVQSGRCSIINLKGIEPQMQEIIASKLLSDLFELRKKGKIPPFFTFIEEAHIFAPERSFGETKASRILRTIASEGRKFGLGLGVVSQRPARVDKSVLSQCSTQLILKVTNPNDLRAISASVEGLTPESEKEIINLPIGTALVTGVVDVPLFVSVRPRKSRHGGEAVDMLGQNFLDEMENFENKELLPIIPPKISGKELEIIHETPIEKTRLIPAAHILCKGESEFKLLVDLHKGGIVHEEAIYYLPDIDSLTKEELGFLKRVFREKRLQSELAPQSLLEKGYVIKEGEDYLLNPSYVFSRLEGKRDFQAVEFQPFKYDEIAEESIDMGEIKEKIGRFVSVLDEQRCYYVEHQLSK